MNDVLLRHAWGGVGVGWGKNVHVALRMHVLLNSVHVTLYVAHEVGLGWGGVGEER